MVRGPSVVTSGCVAASTGRLVRGRCGRGGPVAAQHVAAEVRRELGRAAWLDTSAITPPTELRDLAGDVEIGVDVHDLCAAIVRGRERGGGDRLPKALP